MKDQGNHSYRMEDQGKHSYRMEDQGNHSYRMGIRANVQNEGSGQPLTQNGDKGKHTE